MGLKFINISNLSIEELDVLIALQKSGLSYEDSLNEFSKLHPGKLENLGSLNNEGVFLKETIDENGVHTESSINGLANMIKDVLKKEGQ